MPYVNTFFEKFSLLRRYRIRNILKKANFKKPKLLEIRSSFGRH